jgi:hypothetical protein
MPKKVQDSSSDDNRSTETKREKQIMEAFLLSPHYTKQADESNDYIGKNLVPIPDIDDFDLITG